MCGLMDKRKMKDIEKICVAWRVRPLVTRRPRPDMLDIRFKPSKLAKRKVITFL